MLKTKTLETGGIYREKLVEYFCKIGGRTKDQKTFKGSYWEVHLGSQTWRMLGSLNIQHVIVTFNVEEDKFDEFLAKYRLNFLKAGG